MAKVRFIKARVATTECGRSEQDRRVGTSKLMWARVAAEFRHLSDT